MSIRQLSILGIFGLCLLAACGKATTAEPAQPAPPDPKLASNPDYTKPANYKTECLGRHLLDVPGNMQWAMVDPEKPYYPGSQFTKKIAAQNDAWFYRRLQISATPSTTAKTFDAAKLDLRLDDKLFADSLRDEMARKKNRVREWQLQSFDSTAIQGYKDDIANLEQSIAEFREVDLILPDSYARTRGDNLVAYLWRDKRVWRFATRKYEGEAYDHMAQEFMDTLRHFRPRALYEIPTEPGVCVPYGFFSDDGHAWYEIQNTLRLADAPNVTYTIGLGKNGDDPKPTGFDVWAASFMHGSGAAGMILNRQITQRIKPRTIKIGAMQGILGGFVIKPDPQKGDDQEQSYHLQAGYNGEANSDFFPFVTLQMRSYTEGSDPSLTQPAPPFKQSEERLLGMAMSLRLRPISAH
jgi:hypothetical protein